MLLINCGHLFIVDPIKFFNSFLEIYASFNEKLENIREVKVLSLGNLLHKIVKELSPHLHELVFGVALSKI